MPNKLDQAVFGAVFVLGLTGLALVWALKILPNVGEGRVLHEYSCKEQTFVQYPEAQTMLSFDTDKEGKALFYLDPNYLGEVTLMKAAPFDVVAVVTVMEGGVIVENEKFRLGLQPIISKSSVKGANGSTQEVQQIGARQSAGYAVGEAKVSAFVQRGWDSRTPTSIAGHAEGDRVNDGGQFP